MNCNEVIANIVNRALGGKSGEFKPIHPNDHVNMAQSTNDVFPTAIRVAATIQLGLLIPEIQKLGNAFDQKGTQFSDIIKSGRTHLQDAVPITLGQQFKAYAAATKPPNRLPLLASM